MWAGLSWSIRGREWGEYVQKDFSGFLGTPAFPALDVDKMVLKMGKEPVPGATWPLCWARAGLLQKAHTYHLKLRQTGLRSTDLLPGADGGVVGRSWLAGALKQVLRGVSFPHCWPSSNSLPCLELRVWSSVQVKCTRFKKKKKKVLTFNVVYLCVMRGEQQFCTVGFLLPPLCRCRGLNSGF